jgi:hypothetical protein
MKKVKALSRMLCIVFIFTGFNVLVLGQSEDRNQLATVNGIGSGVRFEVAAVTLTVAAPDGQVNQTVRSFYLDTEFTVPFRSG